MLALLFEDCIGPVRPVYEVSTIQLLCAFVFERKNSTGHQLSLSYEIERSSWSMTAKTLSASSSTFPPVKSLADTHDRPVPVILTRGIGFKTRRCDSQFGVEASTWRLANGTRVLVGLRYMVIASSGVHLL